MFCTDFSLIFTVRIRRMGEGNSFSLFTGGYLPWQGPDGEGVPQGTYPPGQVRMMGEGVPQGTYPPGQVRMMGGGGTPTYLPPGQVRMGQGGTQGTYPPPGQGLATRQVVCLLRSCRRTFLFTTFLYSNVNHTIIMKPVPCVVD